VNEINKQAARLSRLINYPEDVDSLDALRDGISKACDRYRIAATALIDEVLERSQYCPTDFELLQLAQELRVIADMKKPPSRPEPPPQNNGVCECNGQGVRMNDETRDWEFCTCSDGQQVRMENPDIIERLYKPCSGGKAKREGLKRAADIVRDIMAPKVRPITPEDIERARDEARRKREAEAAKPETESNEE
jgi:hypothetical protein